MGSKGRKKIVNALSAGEKSIVKALIGGLQKNKTLQKVFRDSMADSFDAEYHAVKPTKVYLNKKDIHAASLKAANNFLKNLGTLGESSEEVPENGKETAGE